MDELDDLKAFDGQSDTVLLPLFPLRLVLFPGQVLPLHIFEPRYRLMIGKCIEGKEPFGVVLMREDTSDWRRYDGDTALPYAVGTTAHIRQVERLDDGRYNIVVLGLHRFRVRQLNFDRPYLQGEVEAFPLEARTGQSRPRLDVVRQLLNGYMDLLSKIAGTEITLDAMPDDPRTLAFLAASVLQVPLDAKQDLLATPELDVLLETERVMLGREQMLLRYMHATQAQVEEQIMGATGYLFPN